MAVVVTLDTAMLQVSVDEAHRRNVRRGGLTGAPSPDAPRCWSPGAAASRALRDHGREYRLAPAERAGIFAVRARLGPTLAVTEVAVPAETLSVRNRSIASAVACGS
jgi:hypothetical protein